MGGKGRSSGREIYKLLLERVGPSSPRGRGLRKRESFRFFARFPADRSIDRRNDLPRVLLPLAEKSLFCESDHSDG